MRSGTELIGGVAGAVLYRGPRPGVHSEAGVLRTAIVSASLRGGTPGDRCGTVLAETLEGCGVSVLGHWDLLADALGSAEVRRVLVERVVAVAALPGPAAGHLTRVLLRLEPPAAARALLDGLPARDWDRDRPPSPRARFLLPPLPATRSLRSTGVVVGRRSLPALPPADPPETRRAVVMDALLHRTHPALMSLLPARYVHDDALRRSAARVDGDDVQIAADGRLLVGIGHRTTAHGARQLARTLLELGAVREVVVVELPKGASVDRLDRLIAPVDVGTAVVHPATRTQDLRTWTLRLDPADGARLLATALGSLRDDLDRIVGGGGAGPLVLPVVPGSAGPVDLLALEPGSVLTSATEQDPVVRLLRAAGIEVRCAPGVAGPEAALRRMVVPVLRDPLPATATR